MRRTGDRPVFAKRLDLSEHRPAAAAADSSVQRNDRTTTPDPATLLAWYDKHRRDLPWRARAGARSDPYAVWLSEIMLQQTTVGAVTGFYARFLAEWPTIGALAAAPVSDVMRAWAGLGYYTRARNLHGCARQVVAVHGGRFPETEAELRTLPGVGVYTAAAIAAIAFDRPAVVVDGNVERVVSRLFAIETPLPAAKPEIRAAAARLTPDRRPGDFAQAMMDLGSMVCTARRPICALCPFSDACRAYALGPVETFPRKAAKAERPLRRGSIFYVLRADDRLLLGTRPPKGLLGGMSELPGSTWSSDHDPGSYACEPPIDATYAPMPGVVGHVFTHFALELTVFATVVPRKTRAPAGLRWVAAADLQREALPTVMLKVLAHASAQASGSIDRPSASAHLAQLRRRLRA